MRLPWRRRATTAPVAAAPRPASAQAVTPPPPDFTGLENEARYHRERLALYRARVHGAGPTSVRRLEELAQASAAADERLRAARRRGQSSAVSPTRPANSSR